MSPPLPPLLSRPLGPSHRPDVMEPQWTAYSDTPSARYSHTMQSPPHASRDPAVSSQMKHDSYATPSRQNSNAGSVARGPDYNDGDGDVPMEDAYKPRLNMARPGQQHQPQPQQPHSQQYMQQHEESAAARRYSPMNLSPTSPYSANPQQGGQTYTSFNPQAQQQAQTQTSRQSPSRTNPYMSPPSSYYSPPCMSNVPRTSLNESLGRLYTNHCFAFSLAPSCAPAAAHPVLQHEPRELLPAVCDRTAQCCLQQRSPLAAHCF